MLSILENGVDFIKSLLIQDADFFNQMPRAGIVDQELRLLAFFDQRSTKISFIDRIPVYLAQLIAVIIEISIVTTGISVRESPAYPVLICPAYSRLHIYLHMNDRALPPMIEHINVIVFVNDKEHDRSGTEIERHIVANFGAWVTRHVSLEQPPTFNFGHADGGLATTLPEPPPIRFDTIRSHDGCEIFNMGDMVNFRLGRWWCHAILTYPNRCLLSMTDRT